MSDIGCRKGKNTLDLQLIECRKGKKTFFSQTLSQKKEKKVFDNKKQYAELWTKNPDNQANE